jgi:hypothetical protein
MHPEALDQPLEEALRRRSSRSRRRRVSLAQMIDELHQVVRIGVHLATVPGLAGRAVTATVMRDDAIPMLGKEQHQRFPAVAAQRPAMAEHPRLLGAVPLGCRPMTYSTVWDVRPAAASDSSVPMRPPSSSILVGTRFELLAALARRSSMVGLVSSAGCANGLALRNVSLLLSLNVRARGLARCRETLRSPLFVQQGGFLCCGEAASRSQVVSAFSVGS